MTSSILVLVLHVCHIKSTETSGCHPAVLSLGRVTQTFSFGECPEKNVHAELNMNWSCKLFPNVNYY